MAKSTQKQATLTLLRQASKPLSLSELATQLNYDVSERTLRRWLADWQTDHKVQKTGAGPTTSYQIIQQSKEQVRAVLASDSFAFLEGLDTDLRAALLNQIRDLWTHSSTALEGNTLTLGDTHFILEEGLTVSGKPIKDHQEVRGHARAIEILYQCIGKPIKEERVFALHRAVQTEYIDDIYKPIGAWKLEANGTHVVGLDNKPRFIEYALPLFVPTLMAEVLDTINATTTQSVTLNNAAEMYAKIHMGIVHIHPFYDGNGRMARLLANIPLLKCGLPPLVIPQEQRRAYIETLSTYQISIGPLTNASGAWPDLKQLKQFSEFCAACYGDTKELVEQTFEIQSKRART
jgi:Fic family protein